MLMPGAGVGGHCIPKDPWLLAYSVHENNVPLQIIPAARSVNDHMPYHMVELLQMGMASIGKQISGSKILVMGYAYLEDSDDARNSPSQDLVLYLDARGAQIVIHDPYIENYKGDLLEKAQGCEAAVVMVGHQEYRRLDLRSLASVMRTPVLIDGRSVFNPAQASQVGFTYRQVGVYPGVYDKFKLNEVKTIQ